MTFDPSGYLWIGTENGLSKFDGEVFKSYFHDERNIFSLTDSRVTSIFPSGKSGLWVATRNGLNYLDLSNGQFYNDQNDQMPFLRELDFYIEAIVQDKDQQLWVAAGTQGLYKVDLATGSVSRPSLPQEGAEVRTLAYDSSWGVLVGTETTAWLQASSANSWKQLIEDTVTVEDFAFYRDRVYCATEEGLYRVEQNPTLRTDLVDSTFSVMALEVKATYMYVAALDDGLKIYDLQGELYVADAQVQNLRGQQITAVCVGPDQTLWAGSASDGLNFSNTQTNLFEHITFPNGRIRKRKNGSVTSMAPYDSGYLVGTDGGGVYAWRDSTEFFVRTEMTSWLNKALATKRITEILLVNDGHYLIGTYGSGVYEVFLEDRLVKRVPGIKGGLIKFIRQAPDGTTWVGTYFDGVYKLQSGLSGGFSNPRLTHLLPGQGVSDITFNEHRVYVGTFHGLFEGSFHGKELSHFHVDDPEINERMDFVTACAFDEKERLWVGTAGRGVIRIDLKTSSLDAYSTSEGLEDNFVQSIQSGPDGSLWISTRRGLSRMDVDVGLKGYNSHDGLPEQSFVSGAGFLGTDGSVMFGCAKGLIRVRDNRFRQNGFVPPVLITQLLPYTSGTESPLEAPQKLIDLFGKESIDLDYSQNTFRLEFEALSFISSRRNVYSFMLEGWESKWHTSKNAHYATYSNLPSGKYTFRVKASNNDGVWNEEGARLVIVIHQPYWQNVWFILAVIVFLGGIFFFVYRVRVQNIQRQNRILEDNIELRTTQIEQQKNYIERQRDELILQQGRLQESIEVGQSIQRGVLPIQKELKRLFPESFVLFEPKFAIGGDLYWYCDYFGKVLIMTADCTGHGVSGAMLAMIAISQLRDILESQRLLEPGQIMEEWDKSLQKIFQGDGNGNRLSMGMHGNLMVIDRANYTVEYAGAMNHLYYYKKATKELKRLRVNVRSMGTPSKKTTKSFDTHTIQLEQGDTLYMGTDGIRDQFGGKDGLQRLMRGGYESLLIMAQTVPMEHQSRFIQKYMTQWRKNEDATDDQLLIGVQLT